jgi:hypothetical protein
MFHVPSLILSLFHYFRRTLFLTAWIRHAILVTCDVSHMQWGSDPDGRGKYSVSARSI